MLRYCSIKTLNLLNCNLFVRNNYDILSYKEGTGLKKKLVLKSRSCCNKMYRVLHKSPFSCVGLVKLVLFYSLLFVKFFCNIHVMMFYNEMLVEC